MLHYANNQPVGVDQTEFLRLAAELQLPGTPEVQHRLLWYPRSGYKPVSPMKPPSADGGQADPNAVPDNVPPENPNP